MPGTHASIALPFSNRACDEAAGLRCAAVKRVEDAEGLAQGVTSSALDCRMVGDVPNADDKRDVVALSLDLQGRLEHGC